jgi:hypothetical protein
MGLAFHRVKTSCNLKLSTKWHPAVPGCHLKHHNHWVAHGPKRLIASLYYFESFKRFGPWANQNYLWCCRLKRVPMLFCLLLVYNCSDYSSWRLFRASQMQQPTNIISIDVKGMCDVNSTESHWGWKLPYRHGASMQLHEKPNFGWLIVDYSKIEVPSCPP